VQVYAATVGGHGAQMKATQPIRPVRARDTTGNPNCSSALIARISALAEQQGQRR